MGMVEDNTNIKKKFLSKEGYNKLIAERKELIEVKIPENLKTIADAKALWDLSENFEYKSALEEKDLLNSRLNEINELLDNVEIIDNVTDDTRKTKVVGFWSKVRIQVAGSNPRTVVIVGTGEVDIKKDESGEDIVAISLESPLGKAINGKKEGDKARIKTEENNEVTILEIL